MKNLYKSIRWISVLLALVMMLAPMSALAESASSTGLTKTSIWAVLKGGEKIYRDLGLNRAWCAAPRDVIVHVVGYGVDVAILKNGSKYAAVPFSALEPLKAGDVLSVGKKNMRVYQYPSLKSRSMKVPKGLMVELVGISGSCAKVRREGKIGYMYIGCLLPN